MPRRYKASGRNPYIKKESDAKFNYDLVMDEARQKWRTGNWRAESEAFDIDAESFEPEKEEKGERPSAERFKLDVKNDLLGDSISLAALEKLSYSPSYRPSGKLSERITEPMSTPRRYDVLAGLKEAPPEDISFLSDASVRRARVGKHEGALRNDARRLETPVDERRSALLRMMPKGEVDDTSKIIGEAKRRKAREDRELGKAYEEKKLRKRFLDVDPANEAVFNEYMERGVDRLSRIPTQVGISSTERELPEFESMSRRWSEIDTVNPSASDVMRITDNHDPDEDEPDDSRARYVSDVEYDPKRPFRKVKGMPPRERIKVRLDGSFQSVDNEYVRDAGVDPDRIREIMNHRYRGRWIPPEFFNDDELVCEYFHERNRGNIMGEDFVSWARRQRNMVERLEYEESMRSRAKYERHRAPSPGRRAGMPPRPRPLYSDYSGMYEDARLRGLSQGKEIREKSPEPKKSSRPTGAYAGQYPDLFTESGNRRNSGTSQRPQEQQYEQYRRQYEQYQKQMEQYQRQLGEQYRKMQQQNGQSAQRPDGRNPGKRQG